MIRNVAFSTVAFAILLSLAGVACAGERELWKHKDGYFIKLRGNNWQERGTKDEGKFNYDEVKRNDEFVELYDKKRKVTVRLRNNACMYKDEKGEKFSKLYDGSWKD